MKYLKAVAYAIPTSPFADELGGGGYFIQQQVMREDNTWSPPFIEQGYNRFDDLKDPDLHQLFTEVEGKVSPYSLIGGR